MSTAGNPRLGLEQRIGLSELRQRTHGSPQVTVAIIDGPVLPSALSRWGAGTITLLSGPGDDSCALQQSHGALVSLMLAARSDAPLPGLCADCRTLIRPTLGCTEDARGASLHASEDEVAAAVLDCLAQGASIINLSLGLSGSGLRAPIGLLGQALQAGPARRCGAGLGGRQPALGARAARSIPLPLCGPARGRVRRRWRAGDVLEPGSVDRPAGRARPWSPGAAAARRRLGRALFRHQPGCALRQRGAGSALFAGSRAQPRAGPGRAARHATTSFPSHPGAPETLGIEREAAQVIAREGLSGTVCNGAVLPIVTFDPLYSFEQDHFVSMVRTGDRNKTQAERESALALLSHLLQLADNTGAEEEHRALSYLTVRYATIYQRASERQGAGFQLAGIQVKPSRLSADRKVMQVVFEHRNRQTDFTEKDHVRVDVTEKYPFLVSPLQPYYDR